MISIRVDSPTIDYGLLVSWEDGRVTPRPYDEDDKEEWDYILSQGLYGKYGHILNLENCLFVDLVIALSVLYGAENCYVNSEGLDQIKKEKREEEDSPIPQGATS